MGAFKFLTAEEQKDLPKLGFSDFDKTKATLDNLIGNLKWDMYKAQNPGWKSGATEDKAKCLASAKKNAEIIQYAVDTYLSNIDSGIKKDIYKYLNSVYSLNDKSDLSPYFEAKKNASPKGALSDFIAAFDSLDKTAFGTNKPSGESIDKSKELFYPSKTKLYSELAGISGVEDFLVQKGASENMAKEIAMLVAYDVKYGGGKTKELKLGMESEATTAVRNYIKAAYDSLSTDEAKAQFLQDLAEFYYNGVGRARKQIAQFAADKESVKGNKFIDALFAKNENMSAEMKSLSIGLDQFSAGLFNGYGIKSVKFDYKASDFKVEDLNHPLEGVAKFSIALADGKIMDGTIANHIIGAYLAAVSGKDADKTGEALKGIVAYFESQKTIAKVVAPTDLQEQKDLLEPKDLKKEPVKDISKQNAIDRALDLADTKKGQEQQPVSKPGELESTVNQIINSNEKTDWKSIYD
ncbi:MAG TPA: hypothetical protein PLO51_03015, partial [Candidatus Micrarchaeota archaeon]|nr:hypothetical protein [Candidatus Micrarchaeota archaeon]